MIFRKIDKVMINWKIKLFKKNQLFHYKNLDVFPLVITLKHLGLIDTIDDKLKTICEYFDIKIDAHKAISDIEATKKLYEIIVNKFIKKNI
jgi:hypothetical protein